MQCNTIINQITNSNLVNNPFYQGGSNYKDFYNGVNELGYTINDMKKKFRIEKDDISEGTLVLDQWKGLPIIKTSGQRKNCECICGVSIKNQFILRNDEDNVAMVIGSTCITKFLPGDMEIKVKEMLKNLKIQKNQKKLEKNIKEENGWDINDIIQNYKLVGKKKDYIKDIDSDWKDIIDCCDMCSNSYKNDNSYNYLLYDNNNNNNDIIICCFQCLKKLEKKGLKKYIPPPPPPKPCIKCKKYYPSVKDSNNNTCKKCLTKPPCNICGKRYKKSLFNNEEGLCKSCYYKPCANSWCNNKIYIYNKRPYCDNCYKQWRKWKGYD